MVHAVSSMTWLSAVKMLTFAFLRIVAPYSKDGSSIGFNRKFYLLATSVSFIHVFAVVFVVAARDHLLVIS